MARFAIPWSPLLGATLALALGCNNASPSGAATSASASLSPPGAELLAQLTADNPDVLHAANAIVSSGDASTRRAAGPRLVAAWREIGSPAWRAAKKAALQEKNTGHDLSPKWYETQIDRAEKEALVGVGLAMEEIGGADVTAFAFELAEDEKAPFERREGALAILGVVVPSGDGPAVTRRTALAARLDALKATAPVHLEGDPDPPPSAAPDAGRPSWIVNVSIGDVKVSGPAVANAPAVVAGMASGLRRCARNSLAEAQDSVKDGASVLLTATVGPNGEVVSTKPSGVSGLPDVAISCMKARVEAAQFAPPNGNATITFKVTVAIKPI